MCCHGNLNGSYWLETLFGASVGVVEHGVPSPQHHVHALAHGHRLQHVHHLLVRVTQHTAVVDVDQDVRLGAENNTGHAGQLKVAAWLHRSGCTSAASGPFTHALETVAPTISCSIRCVGDVLLSSLDTSVFLFQPVSLQTAPKVTCLLSSPGFSFSELLNQNPTTDIMATK